MNECEHVIVLDVCCTIKRPTRMCLAKKKRRNPSDQLNVHTLITDIHTNHCIHTL